MENPYIIDSIASDSIIIIPKIVLEELDGLKKDQKNKDLAQQAIRNIDEKRKTNVKISDAYPNSLPLGYNISNPDNQILSIAKEYSKEKGQTTILLTQDVNLKIKAEEEKIKVMNLLDFLNSSKKIELKNDHEMNLSFIEAIQTKDKDLVMKFLDDERLDINYLDVHGYTPLIYAVKTRDKIIVSMIVNHPNIDLDKRDQGRLKFTPFLYATQARYIEIMDLLKSKGANIFLGGEGKNQGNNALLVASWDGALEVIKYLLSTKEFSINQTENNGFTALIKAAIKGHTDIVKYLIKAGADTKIRDKKNKTALDYAKENGYREIISLLEGNK